ncbi:Intradiol ring-cleavage dioxygenase [Xylariaceae sp. FL0662B]|nr:Intradiol ring-cleavage dioxygenase [Xylariaceae sp. FL0662B]
MKFTPILALISVAGVFAHPERHTTPEKAKREAKLIGRSTNKCAGAIEARKAEVIARRTERLYQRRVADAAIKGNNNYSKRNELKYTTIQNDTCVLAPETVWGPYGVDGEIMRHDLRESQEGVDIYMDIGLIDVDTCEPLSGAALTIWNCNASGFYSGFTGVNPDTVELLDGWTKRDDGTTDDETFLRGVQISDQNGMVEFLTKFPGYYTSRTTHVHVTVQTDIRNGTSYSASSVQHLGQVFFEEDLINSIYALEPYSAHLATLDRVTNSDDSLFSTANADGYGAVVSVEQIGANLADGLVGYITIGINRTAEAALTTGGSVNPQGFLPTVSVASSKYAEATAADIAAGYTS